MVKRLALEPWTFWTAVALLLVAIFGNSWSLTISTGPGTQLALAPVVVIASLVLLLISYAVAQERAARTRMGDGAVDLTTAPEVR